MGGGRGRRPRLDRAQPLGAAAARGSHLTSGRPLRSGARLVLRTRAPGGRRVPVPGARCRGPALTAAPLERLFTYGTLMTGGSRRPLLGDQAVLEGRARIRGSLYDLGAYPALVLDDGGWVVGEVYRVPDLAARLPALDRAEGCDPENEATSLYVRRRVPVVRDGAPGGDAWVYVYNDPRGPRGRGARIPSGDWRAHRGGRAG